jgi:hypothetical protein
MIDMDNETIIGELNNKNISDLIIINEHILKLIKYELIGRGVIEG